MSKYLKVEDIKTAIIELVKNNNWLERKTTINIIKALGDLPTIDIVPCEDCRWRDDCSQTVANFEKTVNTVLRWCSDGVRRAEGEWVHLAGIGYRCSNCNEYTKSEKPFHKPKGNYCPNCKAKMKG